MFSIAEDFNAYVFSEKQYDEYVTVSYNPEYMREIDYAVGVYCAFYNYTQPEASYYEIKCTISFQVISPEISLAPENFYIIAQNRVSNLLHKKITEQIKDTDPIQLDRMGNRKYESEALHFKLFIQGYAELANGVSQSAAILLDCLMIAATQNGLRDTLVELPLKEYMTMRGLRNEKETRKQVKRDITALERISFEYRSKNKKNWLRVHLSGGLSGIMNGIIVFCFSQVFFDSFRQYGNDKYPFMYFPRTGLQINPNNNPYSYWLLRKIAEHKRMNIGELNADVISVKTLIDACPNYPTAESVRDSNRALTKRLIEPFERDMERLEEFLMWEYTVYPEDYLAFMTATVRIHWRDYPDTPEIRKLIMKKSARKKKMLTKQQKRGLGAISHKGGSD